MTGKAATVEMDLVYCAPSKQSGKRRKCFSLEWSLVSFTQALLLMIIFLTTLASAEKSQRTSHVPKHAASSATEESLKAIRNAPQQNNNHRYTPHYQQHFVAPELPTLSPVNRSPSWYTSQSSNPRMGLSSEPATSSTSTHRIAPSQVLVPRPRSLSDLPSPQKVSKNSTRRKKTSAKKNKGESETYAKPNRKLDLALPETSNELSVINANTDLTAATGRTFFITPFLIYLLPVFIAQLFGMGMIPAAAFVTLPIFLIPLGLLGAVFLI